MTDKRIPRHREAALIEQDNLCYYCQCEMTIAGGDEETACTADHLVPQMIGGRSCKENIVACCFRCNQKKDDSPVFAPKLSGKRHDRNRRFDEQTAERKRTERLAMWRQSVGA